MALTDRDRRALKILGIVAGVAIVAFVLLKVLAGGGGGESAAPPTGTTGPTTSVSPTLSPTPTPRETLPPTSYAGERDPFSIPPALQPTSSGSVSPTSTVSPTGTVSLTGSPSSSISPTPTGSPHPGSSITIGGYHLTLLDIFAGGSKVQIEVDEAVWTVEEGSTFPQNGNFKLVNIRDAVCARFTYGDEGFTLCL